jgi:hypothetical protein
MRLTFMLAVSAAIAGTLCAANAQETNTGEPPAPKISEIMVLQQLRHIKLWFAGRAGNWALADYEVDQLKDGFDDLNHILGGDTVDKAVGAALAALERSVDAKDRASFMRAFDALSAGCNNCHHTLDHAFVVIGRPATLPYSDQVFAAPK